jgi:hypothetical protein
MLEHARLRAVTTLVTTMPQTGLSRHGSQVRRGEASSGAVVTGHVTGDGPHGTGSFPIPHISPSHSPSVQPIRSTLRTSFRSLRDRLAA